MIDKNYTVKIIGLHCLGQKTGGKIDYRDTENWIMELESPMMCFGGEWQVG